VYHFKLANRIGQIVFESTKLLGYNSKTMILKKGRQLLAGVDQLLVSGPKKYYKTNKLLIIE